MGFSTQPAQPVPTTMRATFWKKAGEPVCYRPKEREFLRARAAKAHLLSRQNTGSECGERPAYAEER